MGKRSWILCDLGLCEPLWPIKYVVLVTRKSAATAYHIGKATEFCISEMWGWFDLVRLVDQSRCCDFVHWKSGFA